MDINLILEKIKNRHEFVKVAVTGSAGSGKTIVCNRLKELGLYVIDTDLLAREVVQPGSDAYKDIIGYFGTDVVLETGQLNRSKLRQMITTDLNIKKKFESFVHPRIIALMHKKINEAQLLFSQCHGDSVIIMEVPLLFELKLENMFDMVILVSVDNSVRIRRIIERDNVSYNDAKALLNIQMSEETKKQKSVVIIKNDNSKKDVLKLVDQMYNNIFKNRKNYT